MIYICIPAFNEEQTVGVVLWKIRQVMAEYPRDYQLLVVDDASTDRTPEVLAPYARVLPLTVVRPESRQGESGAVEMMLREAVRRSEYPKRDVVITLQADFTQEPDELVALIKRMEAGADIVVGEAGSRPGAGWWYRWARRLALRVLGSGRMPAGVRDPFTGYRAYRVSVVKGALADRKGRLVHWGAWAGAAELLLAAAPHARRIDTMDVVERRERLQRPSRLRPGRALRDVWSLAREARPIQVASPAELDQAMRSVAAVRTSEVATRQASRSEREEKAKGPRRGERARTTAPTQQGPAARRPEGGRGQRGAAQGGGAARSGRGDKPSQAGAADRSHKGAEAGRRAGRSTRRGEEPRKAPPAPPPPASAEPVAEAIVEPVVTAVVVAKPEPVAVPQATPEKARRKRPRRRKRAGSGAAEARAAAEPAGEVIAAGSEVEPAPAQLPVRPREAPTASSEPDEPADAAVDLPDAAEPDGQSDGEAGDSAQRPRRRRRGRRGGRRRSGGAGDAAAAGTAEGPAGGAETATVAEPSVEVRPQDAGAQLTIQVLPEGDRSHDS